MGSYSVILFYSPTRNYSKWAKLLAAGKFENLEVSGRPNEKRLRQPLLKLVEVYEASKETKESEKLSSSIQRSFDCDDWLQELVAPKGETDFPPQIMIMKAPTLEVIREEYPHPDDASDEILENYLYTWSFKWYAKIDFTKTIPQTQPIRLEYRNGPDSNVFFSEFDGFDIEWMDDKHVEAANADIERTDNQIKAALEARPNHRFQDESDVEDNGNSNRQDDEM